MKFNWQWIKWTAFVVVILLINSAASTLFFRIDLTRNRIHSLSQASKDVVANFEEPLTVKAYFSENLPPPYNNLEQEISDLMEAYSLRGNKFFNYSIHSIGSESTGESEDSLANRADARSYGINPIQIQKVEADEVTLVSAFMGIVFIQGDLIETIPVLDVGENRELMITSTMKKMSDKTGTLLALDKNIQLKLYLSSSLEKNVASLAAYPGDFADKVEELNRQYYGRLDFKRIDPENLAAGEKSPQEYNLSSLTIPLGPPNNPVNKTVYASLVIDNGVTARAVNLFKRSIFGNYSIEDTAALIGVLPGIVDTFVGIDPRVGFLSDHNSRSIYGAPQGQNEPGMNNLQNLLGKNYDLVDVSLADGIPSDVSTLLIVSPREGFSEWELFQLDQYIMKGNSIGFFIDSMTAIDTSGGNPYNAQPPAYLPRNTGLEPLLAHYGITVENSYILDENSYVQTQRDQTGGLREIKYYFAPYIERETIESESVVMGSIKRILLLSNSPLTVSTDAASGVEPRVLFRSSAKSWEMREQINLYNPTTIYPPSDDQRLTMNAAVFIDGTKSSYFKGKSIPDPPVEEEDTDDADNDDALAVFSSDQAAADMVQIDSGDGKIFVIGSSTLLMDNILDAEGRSANAAFLLNLVDTLSNREDYARMRSKGQTYSPLSETSVAFRRLVKGFNIVGLPVIVIFVGIVVLLRSISRKKRIELLFSREVE